MTWKTNWVLCHLFEFREFFCSGLFHLHNIWHLPIFQPIGDCLVSVLTSSGCHTWHSCCCINFIRFFPSVLLWWPDQYIFSTFCFVVAAPTVCVDPLGARESIGILDAHFVVSRLSEPYFRSSKACRTRVWPLWTHVFNFLICCDNPVPVWYLPWHNMMSWSLVPGTPLGLQTLALSYFGFKSSVLGGQSKRVWPEYSLFGHMSLNSRPVVTIQDRCDTSCDTIWCYDVGSLAGHPWGSRRGSKRPIPL